MDPARNATFIALTPTALDASSTPVTMATGMMSSASPDEGENIHIHSISPALFGIVCALTFLGITMALFFLVFNFKYRHHRLIKMSSPNLNMIIIIGAVLLYISSLLFGIDGNLASTSEALTICCKIRLFLVVSGFSLVYGSLFSKSWRVYRIFAHTGAKRMVIRDNRLVGITACLLLVDAFIMAIWLIIDPPECKVVLLPVTSQAPKNESLQAEGVSHPNTPDNVPIVHDAVHGCHSRYNEIWMLLVFLYKALVLLYGTHLSWATRNVALTAMNDSRCIIISVYTCTILVSLATALSMTLWRWPNVWYACLAFVILTCTTEVLLLLHIPKIRAWKDNKHISMPFSRTLTSSYIASNHGQSFMQVEEELFLLSAENAALKRSLREKDDTIKMLQSHVGSAKEKLCQLLVEADGRQDSGCDFDGSSSATSQDAASQDDPTSEGTERGTSETAVTGKPPFPVQDRQVARPGSPMKKKKKAPLKKSKGTTARSYPDEDTQLSVIDLEDRRTVDRPTLSLAPPRPDVRWKDGGDADKVRRRRTRERASSLRSMGSTASQFEDLRKCIAEELHHADHLTSNLRDSIAQDLGACRQRPMYYDMARTEEDILSSLSKSYNLRPGEDDQNSVASSAFTYDNPVFSRDQASRRSSGSRRTGKASRQSSFRSVASIALEIAESYTRRDKNGDIIERELQWPSYIPPKDAKVRSGEPLRIVRSSEAPTVFTRSVYNTYV